MLCYLRLHGSDQIPVRSDQISVRSFRSSLKRFKLLNLKNDRLESNPLKNLEIKLYSTCNPFSNFLKKVFEVVKNKSWTLKLLICCMLTHVIPKVTPGWVEKIKISKICKISYMWKAFFWLIPCSRHMNACWMVEIFELKTYRGLELRLHDLSVNLYRSSLISTPCWPVYTVVL